MDFPRTPERLTAEDEALLESFRARYAFPLDPFQERALGHVLRDESVIVSAPTGAGKTLIAEFAIARALARQQRLAYTTPIKALSNQKYADFVRQYGEETVGILTGDVKVNPHAPIVVMTTEILRNMFYSRTLEEVAYVVLDECHYLGDEGRGTVWEEIIITCPKTVQIVALSATVSNIAEIAGWIGETHRPIASVVHPVRPVPLTYFVADPRAQIRTLDRDAVRRILEGEVGEGARLRPGAPRWGRGRAPERLHRRRPPWPSRVIPPLERRGWLPAIYFIFSRSGCEAALRRFVEDGRSLIDPAATAEVEAAVARTLADYPSISTDSPTNAILFEGLPRGVGMHHAGILPALKRLTEVLFERGLVQVVFATETMSLGIHMPAKTVVIEGLRKRTDFGFRHLTLNELTQMAGRAGRRGIDPAGQCVVAVDSADTAGLADRLIRGRPEPIESQFRIGYSSAALLVERYRDPALIRRTVESSFGQFQNRKQMGELEARLADLTQRFGLARGYQAPCGDISNLFAYRGEVAVVEAERKAERAGWPGRRPGVEGGRGRARRHREREAGAGGRGPGAGEEGGKGEGRVVWRAGRRVEVGRVEPEEEGRASIGVDARLATLQAMPCHFCPYRPTCERTVRKSHRTSGAIETTRRALEQLRGNYWEEFLRVMAVLRHFGYVADGALATGGRLIAGLRHDNELLVARVALGGLLDDLTPPETVALLSCLLEEPRETDMDFARPFLKRWPHLRPRLRGIEALAEEVAKVQAAHRVTRPVSLHLTHLAAAHRWAEGEEDWSRLLRETYAGHEGDLIRAFRRLIDLGRQLAESPQLPEALREALWQGVKGLDRGIVFESALL